MNVKQSETFPRQLLDCEVTADWLVAAEENRELAEGLSLKDGNHNKKCWKFSARLMHRHPSMYAAIRNL